MIYVKNTQTESTIEFRFVKQANEFLQTGLDRPSYGRLKEWADTTDKWAVSNEPFGAQTETKPDPIPETVKTPKTETVKTPELNGDLGAQMAQLMTQLLGGQIVQKSDLATITEGLENLGKLVGDHASKIDKLQDKPQQIEIKKFDGTKKNIGVAHKCFPQLMATISAGINAYLVGPAGSFKTSTAKKVSDALDLPFYFTSVCAQTTKSDLVGFMNAKGEYVSTAFRKAYENGGVFLLDEIDAGNPNVITLLNAALDNGQMSFPDKIVDMNNDFKCIAAGNTYANGADIMYVGRNPLDGASIDRFAFIQWDYDETLEKSIATNMEWLNIVIKYRRAAAKLSLKHIISPRATFSGEKLIAAGISTDDAVKMVILKGLAKRDIDRLQSEIKK